MVHQELNAVPPVDGGEKRPFRRTTVGVVAGVDGGARRFGRQAGIGAAVVDLFALGVPNNRLGSIDFDSLLESRIRRVVVMATVLVNFRARRSRTRSQTAA